MLVENINFDNKSDFVKFAGSELEKSGICSYKQRYYIFKVNFDASKNPEYSKYYMRLKQSFEMNKKSNDQFSELQFPNVNSVESDEKYLIVMVSGRSVNNTLNGPWFFNDLSDVFDTLTEAYLNDYVETVLENDDFSSALKNML